MFLLWRTLVLVVYLSYVWDVAALAALQIRGRALSCALSLDLVLRHPQKLELVGPGLMSMHCRSGDNDFPSRFYRARGRFRFLALAFLLWYAPICLRCMVLDLCVGLPAFGFWRALLQSH